MRRSRRFAARTAMPAAAPTMQREAIGLAVVSVRPVAEPRHGRPTIFIACVERLFARVSLLPPVVRLGLPELLLRRGDQAKIVLGVLKVILRAHRIARGLGVACELDVLLRDV